MTDDVRRSKRMRHNALDPSYHYSPAAKKPKAQHIMQHAGVTMPSNAVKHHRIASDSAGADTFTHAYRHAEGPVSAALPAAGLKPAAASKNRPLSSHVRKGAIAAVSFATQPGIAGFPQLDATATQTEGSACLSSLKMAGSPQPSGDASNDSSSDQVQLPEAGKANDSGLFILHQEGPKLAKGSKPTTDRQPAIAIGRKSRHKGKPVRSPFE